MTSNGDIISRDDAIALIEGFQRELCPVGMYGRHAVYGSDREKFDDWQFIIDELDKIPAVDAAPVVRCRDCKYYNVTCCSPGFGWCERSGHNHGTTDDWFCADGVMKYD